jgi:pilus assembly protein Flp/PilA
MRNFLTRLMTEEEGATMVEYALMVALIAAAAIGVVGGLSTALNGKFTSVSGDLGGTTTP